LFLKVAAGWMTQGGEQKVKWYKKVNTDAKAAYLLALSEMIVYKISGCEWFQEAREAMDRCWEWVEEKKHTGLGLYETLDRDGEDGENGLFLKQYMKKSSMMHKPGWFGLVSWMPFVIRLGGLFFMNGKRVFPKHWSWKVMKRLISLRTK
jgi:hypothetical protein